MKLIDRIMREICAEMEWVNVPSPELFSGSLRTKLTPVAEAADAVIEAARRLFASLMDDAETKEAIIEGVEARRQIRDALAALDEVRDV